ncbi:MAG: DsbE family thiol:disulfide interchange protein [Bradyrhizobium sp.]
MVLVTAACLLAISVVVVGFVLLFRRFVWKPFVVIRREMSTHIIAANGFAVDDARSGIRRIAFLIPLAAFAGLAFVLAWGMSRDPGTLPSALIDKPVPEFRLPPVKGRSLGLASADLNGEVSLVNVFASWCTACREEHPVFMRLNGEGVVPIHGLDYKDQPDDAARWLNTMGDPYARTGADIDGRTAIDWGVYGVPETFVVTKDGRIAYKHIGAMTPKVLEDRILPLIRKLREQ